MHFTTIVSCCLVAAAMPLAQAGAASQGPAPAALGAELEVVARVNGEPVTRGELERVLKDPLARGRLEHELAGPDADRRALELRALRELVHERLLLQEASRRSILVTEDELDQALTALRLRFDTLADFGVWMKERGVDDTSLFEMVRAQVQMRRAWEALVQDVRVSEAEVRDAFEAHEAELVVGDDVRLQIIAVRSSVVADAILEALSSGASFASLAREHSTGMLATRGGDTGWIDFRSLPPHLQYVVARMDVGDVAGPLERTTDELLLVGLADRRPRHAESLAEARAAIERRLLAEKQQGFMRAWFLDQEDRAAIELIIAGSTPRHARAHQPPDHLRSAEGHSQSRSEP